MYGGPSIAWIRRCARRFGQRLGNLLVAFELLFTTGRPCQGTLGKAARLICAVFSLCFGRSMLAIDSV